MSDVERILKVEDADGAILFLIALCILIIGDIHQVHPLTTCKTLKERRQTRLAAATCAVGGCATRRRRDVAGLQVGASLNEGCYCTRRTMHSGHVEGRVAALDGLVDSGAITKGGAHAVSFVFLARLKQGFLSCLGSHWPGISRTQALCLRRRARRLSSCRGPSRCITVRSQALPRRAPNASSSPQPYPRRSSSRQPQLGRRPAQAIAQAEWTRHRE
eukprot:scaffold94401_cov33-Tisochrysis_lutea.AAC.2